MFALSEVIRQTASRYNETHHWWEWQIPVYLFLGGVVAGLMILSAIRFLQDREERSPHWRLLAWFAPILLSLGMFALWLDLSAKLNVWRFYTTLEVTAPMSWGAWILLLVYPATILFALSEFPLLRSVRIVNNVAGWASRPAVKNRIAWSNLALGIVLGIYTGILLSNMVARPLWNSAILGPLFLVSGLSTGAAFMLLFRLKKNEKAFLGRLDIVFILLEILLILVFIMSMVNGSAIQQEAVGQLLGGPFTAWFWSFVIVIGLVVPLLLSLYERRSGHGHNPVIPIFVLIGGFALRWILVYAGQVQVW